MTKAIQKLTQAINKTSKRRGNSKPSPKPENLVPYQFKPGQSGNPGGRPKEHLRDALGHLAESTPPPALCASVGVAQNSTWVQAIAYALGVAAMSGDTTAMRLVFERLDPQISKAIVGHVSADDPATMVGYSRFKRETCYLSESQMEQVYALCRQLNVRPTMAEILPPESSELWDDESKLLTEREDNADEEN